MDRILRHPKIIVAVIGALTLFFALQLPRIQIDNNNFRFVPKENEARVRSAAIDDEFGSSLFILVGLNRPWGDVFDAEFLRTLKKYVEDVEALPLLIDGRPVIGKVNSLVTADYINGDADSIIAEDLVDYDFTGTPEEIAALKEKVLSWDMYNRSLVSDDLTASQVIIPLDIHTDDAGKPEIVSSYLQIRDMAQKAFDGQAEVFVSGIPVITATINESLKKDLIILIPIVVFVVLFVIWLPLRHIGFVLLSVLAVVIAAVWSIGMMPLLGVKLSVITTVMPVVLVAVGNSYGLHVVVHYIEDAASRGQDFLAMTYEEHRQFVASLARRVFVPVLLAAVTTMVSFLSFCFTKIIPIREFGIFSAIGVLVAFITAILLLPSLIILRGPKALSHVKKSESAESAPGHHQAASLFMNMALHSKTVVALTLILAAFSAFFAVRVVIDNVFVEYFKAKTDIVKADAFIRAKFGGSKAMSFVVRADDTETLLHPDTLEAVDGLETYLTTRIAETGKVTGFTDLIKRINQVFNVEEGGASFYEIPGRPEKYGKTTREELGRLTANYLVLLSGDIGDYANDPLEPTAIRTLVQLRVVGQIDTDRVIDGINAYAKANLPPGVTFEVGGPALVEKATNDLVVHSVWQSMSIAFVFLFIILTIVNRSFLAGAIGVIPLLVLILVNLAVMGAVGIKLNVGTALIFSLTMGIGIDYTIHFLEAYKYEIRAAHSAGNLDYKTFLHKAYLTSGVAILVDAGSTAAGFLVLLLSQFVMLAEFGFLVAVSLVLSAFVGLVLIPALLLLIKPRFVLGRKQ